MVLKLTPEERSIQARAAAHRMHALHGSQVTVAGRRASMERFEKQVDPEGVLDPAERARRAAHLKKAFYLTLSLKSAQARRARRRSLRNRGAAARPEIVPRPSAETAAACTGGRAPAGPGRKLPADREPGRMDFRHTRQLSLL